VLLEMCVLTVSFKEPSYAKIEGPFSKKQRLGSRQNQQKPGLFQANG
jgi:hypothetical protein